MVRTAKTYLNKALCIAMAVVLAVGLSPIVPLEADAADEENVVLADSSVNDDAGNGNEELQPEGDQSEASQVENEQGSSAVDQLPTSEGDTTDTQSDAPETPSTGNTNDVLNNNAEASNSSKSTTLSADSILRATRAANSVIKPQESLDLGLKSNSQYTYILNSTSNSYITNSAYASYYNANSPLGIAGNFHVVAFNRATSGVHLDGNVLAKNLKSSNNWGTNGVDYELSYVQVYEGESHTCGVSNLHQLFVVGSTNTVTTDQNGDALYLNNSHISNFKIDDPKTIVRDSDTSEAPFINLSSVQQEMLSLSSALASNTTNNGVSDLVDVTSDIKKLTVTSSDTAFYNIKAENNLATREQTSKTFGSWLYVDGFDRSTGSTLVINVDCAGVTNVYLPGCKQIFGDSEILDHKERDTSDPDWSQGRIVWNFYNTTADTIVNANSQGGNSIMSTILAPSATVNFGQVDGTVIAYNANHDSAESHRMNFGGTLPSGGEDPTPVEPTVETTTVTVEKLWKDAEQNLLPEEDRVPITLNLVARIGNDDLPEYGGSVALNKDGSVKSEGYTGVLSSSNVVKATSNSTGSWKYEFKDLPTKTNDGVEISYSVVEGELEGFTSSVGESDNTWEITNTKNATPAEETTSITVKKVWQEESSVENADNVAAMRPNITFNIIQNSSSSSYAHVTLNGKGKVTDIESPNDRLMTSDVTVIYGGIATDANSTWTCTIANLPKLDSEGKEITYSVSETMSGSLDYISSSDVGGAVTNGGTITNTKQLVTPTTTDLAIQKHWNDTKGKEAERAATFNIMQAVDDQSLPSMYAAVTLKYSADGSVVSTISPSSIAVVDGLSVTAKTVDDENSFETWKCVVKGLPTTNSEGKELTYTVREQLQEGYEASTAEQVSTGVWDITNTQTADVVVKKVWNDTAADSPEHPAITLHLMRQTGDANNSILSELASFTVGSEGKVTEVSSSSGLVKLTSIEDIVVLQDDGINSYTFKNLPVKDTSGNVITYTVVEEDVAGYTSSVKKTEDGSITVTNTRNTTSVKAQKIWHDAASYGISGETHSHPNITLNIVQSNINAPKDDTDRSVYAKVNLNSNGEITNIDDLEKKGIAATCSVSQDAERATDTWSYEFKNLPEMINGTKVTYSVEEDLVPPGYTSTSEKVSESNIDTWVITNQQNINSDMSVTVQKKWDDKEGSPSNRPAITLNLMQQVVGAQDPALYASIVVTRAADGILQIRDAAGSMNSVVGSGQVSVSTNGTSAADADANTWICTFTDLPSMNSSYEPVTYLVAEQPTENADYALSEVNKDQESGIWVITNTRKVTDLSITKEWLDMAGNAFAPADDQSITLRIKQAIDGAEQPFVSVTLWANGNYSIDSSSEAGKALTVTLDVSRGSTWACSINNLPATVNGKQVSYSVSEDAVDGYDSTVVSAESGTNGIQANVWKVTNQQQKEQGAPQAATVQLSFSKFLGCTDSTSVAGKSFSFALDSAAVNGSASAKLGDDVSEITSDEVTVIAGTADALAGSNARATHEVVNLTSEEILAGQDGAEACTFSFPDLSFTEAGTYWYLASEKVSETHASDSIVYDQARYLVQVVVDEASGEDGKVVLEAQTIYWFQEAPSESFVKLDMSEAPEFCNNDSDDISVVGYACVMDVYDATISAEEAWIEPEVRKDLVGRNLKAGEFEFALTPVGLNGDAVGQMIIATNDAYGEVCFAEQDMTSLFAAQSPFLITEPGDYYYEIHEVIPGGAEVDTNDGTDADNADLAHDDSLMTYDESSYIYWVHATENEIDGHKSLHVTTSYYKKPSSNASMLEIMQPENKLSDDVPTFVNEVDTGITLQVRKQSKDETHDGLQGSTYGLWMVNDDGNDAYLGNATSDADGWIVFENMQLVTNRRYYFKEEAPPEGHLVDAYRSAVFMLVTDPNTGVSHLEYESAEDYNNRDRGGNTAGDVPQEKSLV